MGDEKKLTPVEHKGQIEAYAAERPHYETYAKAMERVLRQACGVSLPEAVIQTRPKTVSSFAEKCVRKWAKYAPNPLEKMTDLCGGRIIVQTLEQVEAVKLFVEANFVIHERDEKGTLLGDDRFGYRDMHYIVSLREDRCEALGFTAAECDAIGERKAELQVRTWLQHAWADTLHDRIYKTSLRLPPSIRRTGNLLAALMEEGDRNFNAMAHDIDGMRANYAAIASRRAVEDEIAAQRLILENEPSPAKRPALALALARMLAACGDHAGVVELLAPDASAKDANQCERLIALGTALCQLHRAHPGEADYLRGLDHLRQALDTCECAKMSFVPNLRLRESLHARALARLAWALEIVRGQRAEAGRNWRRAHEHEPANPYYLAGMLCFEVEQRRRLEVADTLRVTILEAIRTCHSHIVTNTEMPQACFTAGRLNLLLRRFDEALACYCRGIRHMLDGTRCVAADLVRLESEALGLLQDNIEAPPDELKWTLGLLDLAARIRPRADPIPTGLPPRAVMVAGGAISLDPATVARFRPLVEAALEPFAGTVVSGGTAVGVPGCVGDVTRDLRARGACRYTLRGYVPKLLPPDAPIHDAYDVRTHGDSRFSAEQVLAGWRALLDERVAPEEVLCLGIGGGPVSSIEYRIALALGATVAVVSAAPAEAGDAAACLAADPLWAGTPTLFPVPLDAQTVRALVVVPTPDYPSGTLEEMAMAFHAEYVRGSAGKLPDPMKPWSKLETTYKTANLEQAKYAVQVLEACGFEVRPAADPAHPVIFDAATFTADEVERMARMEHGRWNVERLRNGWRPGPRDDTKKLHPCLVPWDDKTLTEEIKDYDRNAVRKFPEILAKAGLEVVRRPAP